MQKETKTETVAVTFDLNKLFEAYNKPEFMKGVFIDYLSKNPEMIAKHVSATLIVELVKANKYEEIQKQVGEHIAHLISKDDSILNQYEIRGKVFGLIGEAIEAQSERIKMVVANQITKNDFGKKVAESIGLKVTEYVSKALRLARYDEGRDE